MAKKTERLRKVASRVARRAGDTLRKVEKRVKKEVRRRQVREAARAAGQAALVQGSAALAGAAAAAMVRAKRRGHPALGFEVALHLPLEAAVTNVVEALRVEGFGILTRIDAHTVLREKLGASFRPFVILGACNPSLAYRSLSARAETGLLLPCNVTVEERPAGGSLIRIANPEALLAAGDFANDPELLAIAREASERLRHAVDILTSHAERVVL